MMHDWQEMDDWQEYDGQGDAGAEAYDAGLPLDTAQAQDWQDGWLGAAYASGVDAHEDGLPLDDDAHPAWIEGWQNSAGEQARQDGLPLDDDAHPAWIEGWQYAAHTDGWRAAFANVEYDPDAPTGWRAGWMDAYSLAYADDQILEDDAQSQFVEGFWQGSFASTTGRKGQGLSSDVEGRDDRYWQAGWRQAKGVSDARAGLAYDQQAHPDWHRGWRAVQEMRRHMADIW